MEPKLIKAGCWMAFLPKQYSSFRVKSKWQQDAADQTTSRCNMEATRFTTASGLEDLPDHDSKKFSHEEKSLPALQIKDHSVIMKQSTGAIPEFRSKFLGILNLPYSKYKVPLKPIRLEHQVKVGDSQFPSELTNSVSISNGTKDAARNRASDRFLLGRVKISPIPTTSEAVTTPSKLGSNDASPKPLKVISQKYLLQVATNSHKSMHSPGIQSRDVSSPISLTQVDRSTFKPAAPVWKPARKDSSFISIPQEPLVNHTLDEAMCLESQISKLCDSSPRPSQESQSVAQEDPLSSKVAVPADLDPSQIDAVPKTRPLVRLPQGRIFKNLLSLPTPR